MKERGKKEDLDVDGRLILKLILEKYDGVYTGFIGVKMASLVNTVKNFICP
jgi:hypothetical protein